MPKSAPSSAARHEPRYHHRGQLSVYLRLLTPVPSIYGPSATRARRDGLEESQHKEKFESKRKVAGDFYLLSTCTYLPLVLSLQMERNARDHCVKGRAARP